MRLRTTTIVLTILFASAVHAQVVINELLASNAFTSLSINALTASELMVSAFN